MAARTIAIRIVVDSSNSVTDIDKVNAALDRLKGQLGKNSQLQDGLTNSFIKGNLAARGISATYLFLRDSVRLAAAEAIGFEFALSKISAITDTTGPLLDSLKGKILEVASATRQSQTELAQTALEMAKIGLSALQVEEALDGVAKLARGLDEPLVQTGATLVAVLNAYQFEANQSAEITDKLAYTVKASALDIQSFSTAFAYVGGSAHLAGVSFEDLTAAMDVLSNSGIRASTIGTQLRRIISDLSNEHSKASAVLGGKTLKDYASLSDALADLASKNLTLSDYTAIFGRTASSVIAILANYNAQVGDLSKQTKEANGLVDKMSDTINDNLKGAIDDVKTSWQQLGITILASNGWVKDLTSGFASLIKEFNNWIQVNVDFDEYQKSRNKDWLSQHSKLFRVLEANFQDGILTAPTDTEGFKQYQQQKKDAQDLAKINSDIVNQLAAIIDKQKAYNYEVGRSKGLVLNAFDTILKPEVYEKLKQNFTGSAEEFSKAFGAALRKAGTVQVDPDAESQLDKYLPDEAAIKKAQKALEDYVDGLNKAHLDQFLLPTRFNAEPQDFNVPVTSTNLDTQMADAAEALKNSKADEMARKLNEAIIQQNILLAQSQVQVLALATAFESLASAVNQVGYQFGEQLVESITRGKNAFKDFDVVVGNILKDLIAKMVQMLIKLILFRVIATSFGLATGGAGSFAFAAGGSALQNGLLGALGGKNIGVQNDGDRYPTGGTRQVDKPTWMLVGDQGSEQVSVTPRAKLNKSSDRSIKVYIQGDVLDGAKFEEAIALAEKRNKGRSL